MRFQAKLKRSKSIIQRIWFQNLKTQKSRGYYFFSTPKCPFHIANIKSRDIARYWNSWPDRFCILMDYWLRIDDY